MRWVTLLSLLAGYAVTSYADPVFRVQYAVCTLASAALFFLLLTRLNRSARATLPFWVLLAYVWLAYYAKFYLVAVSPDFALAQSLQKITAVSPLTIEAAFTTITVACAGVFATAWILIGPTTGGRARPQANGDLARQETVLAGRRRTGAVALWLAVGLSVVTTVVTLRTGVGVMGVDAPDLPYHLSGIVTSIKQVLEPALFLLAFWAALESGQRRRATVVLLVIVAFGVMESLLRSSRGALVSLMLAVLFLLILTAKLKRFRPLLVAGALVVVVLQPVVSGFRWLRIVSPDTGIGQLVATASREVFSGGGASLGDVVAQGAAAYTLRATGAEILVLSNALRVRPLGGNAFHVLRSERGVWGVVTERLFGIAPEAHTAYAPGIVGWFYLLGGNGFVLLGLVAFTLLVHGAWTGLLRLHLRTEPVALALFLTWFTMLIVDGGLESVVSRTVVIWPLSMLACEWLARTVHRRAGRTRAAPLRSLAYLRAGPETSLQSLAEHPQMGAADLP